MVLECHTLQLRQRQPGIGKKHPQGLKLVFPRATMHPVKRWHAMLFQKTGSSNIGADHALLDNLVRHIPRHRHNFLYRASHIKLKFGFVSFKINRPTPTTGLGQGPIQLMQFCQMRQQFAVFF